MRESAIPSGLSLSSPDFIELMRDILGRGAAFRFRAAGCSMSPFIRDGDMVTLSARATFTMGHIAAFTSAAGNRLIIHRIIRTREGEHLIKGDNACCPDGWVPRSRILGHVVRIERCGRSIRIGVGPGKRLVAIMSRFRILPSALTPLRRLSRFVSNGTPAT